MAAVPASVAWRMADLGSAVLTMDVRLDVFAVVRKLVKLRAVRCVLDLELHQIAPLRIAAMTVLVDLLVAAVVVIVVGFAAVVLAAAVIASAASLVAVVVRPVGFELGRRSSSSSVQPDVVKTRSSADHLVVLERFAIVVAS